LSITVTPLSSTIVAVGLIPVAFLFCHAFLSDRKKNRFHPVSAVLAILWDLSLSIGYMLYRTFGGAVDAVLVMALEVSVLTIGLSMLKQKAPNRWHPKLTKILFGIWWFAFLSGEIVYIALYML
jgi:uncharacterized membrane protein YozB (DUF420 family)